jgi:hypothetical protein
MLFEKKTNLLFLLREHINMVFLLRELVCVFTARTQPKKIASFYCTNWENVFTSRTKEKKNLFTARTRVLLLRELNKKKMFLFTARTCVWSHRVNSEKNKKFYCTNSITISFEISCSYCANSIFFSKCTNCIKSLSKIHTEHISYKHQKKWNLFDCANSQNKIVFTARTK